ncbi:regulator of chromosome condensation 1/beta-lactamase-inhibitor protein II [Haematococcus lacustris]
MINSSSSKGGGRVRAPGPPPSPLLLLLLPSLPTPLLPQQPKLGRPGGGRGTAVRQARRCWWRQQQQQRGGRLKQGPGEAGHTSQGDSSQASAALLSPGGVPLAAQLTASGLTPGCVHTPTRIGRDQHPLGEAHHAAALSPSGLRLVGASGLEQERVVGLAASRHFSVAVTAAGEVWTWGACYNGALGTHSSWSTSAQKVCGALAQAIGDAGGAIKAVAGGTFCAVLTANGKVLLWGKLPGPEVGSADVLQVAEGLAMTLGARLVVGEVPGLPPIRHLVAGQQHLLLSDGERVWSIGRGLDAAGQEASLAPWSLPQAVWSGGPGGRAAGAGLASLSASPAEVLSCAAEGVSSLAAGAHSSAAVTGDGRLWMWGRLLDQEHVRGLRQRHQAMRMDPEGGEGEGWGEEGREGGSSTWQWPGFGAPHPQLVEGLGGRVRGVALGGWHALALGLLEAGGLRVRSLGSADAGDAVAVPGAAHFRR